MKQPRPDLTTVLLDLDDTLLTIDMDRFVAAYIKGISLALANFAPVADIPPALLNATRAIRENDDPVLTNEQVFFDSFLPHLNGPIEQIEAALAIYFTATYPSLKQYTAARPAAPRLMQALLARSYKVVIATNPLYPRPAIQQRMAWAGVLEFPYPLVTTRENMHACKPSLAYYREILQTIHSEPAETLMVGDDPKNDITPAQTLGCKTWWIPGNKSAPEDVAADYQGTLAELLTWLESDGLVTE